MVEDKPYYSPEEVAEYFDVTPETIRNLCRAKKIPGARQVGRQWRIPREYLFSNPTIDEGGQDEKRQRS